MTLLAPWGAVIAAAAGLCALSLLYVLRLRRRALRIGSTILWQQATREVEVNTPWKRFSPDWLFVIQALAVVLLALAVGRPAVGIGPSGNRVVVVIDTSASMSAMDSPGGSDRLTLAKSAAVETLRSLRRARTVEAAVVVTDAQSRIAAPFSRDPASAIDAINSARATDLPGSLDALLQTLALLSPPPQEDGETTSVFVFSDGGFAPAVSPTPGGLSLRLVRVGPEPGRSSANVGFTAVSAQRRPDDPATIDLTLKIQSALESPQRALVRVSAGGSVLGSATVELPAARSRPVVADGPDPVEVIITVAVQRREGGTLTAELMYDDPLASDNFVNVVVDGVGPPTLWLVGPGEGGEDADPLLVNFAQSAGASLVRLDGRQFAARVSVEPALPGVDLLIFDRVTPSIVPPVASISLGGTVPGARVQLVRMPERGEEKRPIITWDRQHPLMRDVNLDSVLVRQDLALTVQQPAQSLITGVSGPLAVALTSSDGIDRVLLAFSRGESTWGSDLSFVVFLSNAIDRLTLRGKKVLGQQWAAGEPITLLVPAGTSQVTVQDGQGTSVEVPVVAAESPFSLVSIGAPGRVGVYATAPAAPGQSVHAVNLRSPIESQAMTRDSLPLRGSRAESAAEGSARPREVWDLFVLAGLGLLAVEWFLYAFFARR